MAAINDTRILLVHGALADASSWSKVIPQLQAAGFSVTAVQEPLTSVADDISFVKSAIQTLNSASSAPILIVGHSFGGLVITNAATGEPNIGGLVYVQAAAPDQGETVGNLNARYPHLPSEEKYVPTADGRVVLPQQDFLQYFAPDLPKSEALVFAATQGPFDTARFDFVSGKPAWKYIKNLHYIVGTDDQIVSPELEAFFAKRMGAKTTVLNNASHISLVSRAHEVAQVIIEAAKSCH